VLLKQAAAVAKGSPNAKATKVGSVTKAQIMDIVKTKFEDLNSPDFEQAAMMIRGTARSMGIEVLD
jgi:large subunit ribosomal protein L11